MRTGNVNRYRRTIEISVRSGTSARCRQTVNWIGGVKGVYREVCRELGEKGVAGQDESMSPMKLILEFVPWPKA